MCAKKSSDVNTSIDVLTNIINVGLFVAGIFLITLGVVYMLNAVYDYLMRIGTIIVIAGVVAIIVGAWGTFNHARIVKKMKAQAKANLNY